MKTTDNAILSLKSTSGFLAILVVFLFSSLTLLAQAPQKMSYQAVIRDATGKLVTNQVVGMRITILQGALPGNSVYQETQTPTTNANGLVTVEFGGSTGFDAINWGNGPFFIKTETDPAGGANYTITGTSQLLSVPYAFQARMAEGVADNSITMAKIANAAVTGTKIAQGGATDGQVLKWKDRAWTPANDLTGTVSGTAGGDLTGTYPNPVIDDAKVTSTKILDGTVGTADLSNFAVTGSKIAQMGATNGQFLRFFSKTSNWAPDDPIITTAMIDTLAVTTEKINSLAVTTDKIGSLAVTSAKLASGAVTMAKIAQGGAATGHVLKWNSIAWAPSNEIWNQNTSNEAYINNFVGIGTNDPEHNLDILNSTAAGTARIYSTFSNAGLFVQRKSSTNFSYLGFNTGTTANFWMGLLGNNNFRISTSNAALNGLEVKSDGDVNISNNINVTGEVRTPQSGEINMLPWAIGEINADATVKFGTSNVLSANKIYGGRYFVYLNNPGPTDSYIVLITATNPNGGPCAVVIVRRADNGFDVILSYDNAARDTGFGFVVYKP